MAGGGILPGIDNVSRGAGAAGGRLADTPVRMPDTASMSPPTCGQMCNALRALAMDAVQKANSGHPGMPMGMAEIAYVLWHRHLRHNPSDPQWADRDRFVLSNGHGSMLLYALLHLSGYGLPIEQLSEFRQLHSRTPELRMSGRRDHNWSAWTGLGQRGGHGAGRAVARCRVQSIRFPDR
jgi:transketolase